jgi:hypothetical protein
MTSEVILNVHGPASRRFLPQRHKGHKGIYIKKKKVISQGVN